MNIVTRIDRGAVTVTHTIYCKNVEFVDLRSALVTLLVPSPTPSVETARQTLLSEISEYQLIRMKNLLTDLTLV